MSLAANPIYTDTDIATAAVSGQTFVTWAGAPAGAGAHARGIARTDAAIGAAYPVDMLGTALVKTGGVFNKGDLLQSDANGAAVVLGSGVALARACAASSASGRLVEAFLITN